MTTPRLSHDVIASHIAARKACREAVTKLNKALLAPETKQKCREFLVDALEIKPRQDTQWLRFAGRNGLSDGEILVLTKDLLLGANFKDDITTVQQLVE